MLMKSPEMVNGKIEKKVTNQVVSWVKQTLRNQKFDLLPSEMG